MEGRWIDVDGSGRWQQLAQAKVDLDRTLVAPIDKIRARPVGGVLEVDFLSIPQGMNVLDSGLMVCLYSKQCSSHDVKN